MGRDGVVGLGAGMDEGGRVASAGPSELRRGTRRYVPVVLAVADALRRWLLPSVLELSVLRRASSRSSVASSMSSCSSS